MAAPLTVHNAQIKTAAVEVKTLTISGKQVTLAVFRQLMEECLVDDETNALNGVPWGMVNYHPDKSCDWRTHLHVVWQKGADLRRSTVYAPEHARLASPDVAYDAVIQLLAYGVTRNRSHPDGITAVAGSAYRSLSAIHDQPRRVELVLDSGSVMVELSAPEAERFYRGYGSGFVPTAFDQEELAFAISEVNDHLQAYSALWRGISDLPQLFIAV